LIQLLAAGGNSSTLNDVEPGLLGFLIVAGLAVALVFLLRSMNKQFRKLGPGPEDTEGAAAPTADEAGDGDDAAGVTQHGSARQDAPRQPAEQDAGSTAP
jgi:hypothetical protein